MPHSSDNIAPASALECSLDEAPSESHAVTEQSYNTQAEASQRVVHVSRVTVAVLDIAFDKYMRKSLGIEPAWTTPKRDDLHDQLVQMGVPADATGSFINDLNANFDELLARQGGRL